MSFEEAKLSVGCRKVLKLVGGSAAVGEGGPGCEVRQGCGRGTAWRDVLEE